MKCIVAVPKNVCFYFILWWVRLRRTSHPVGEGAVFDADVVPLCA